MFFFKLLFAISLFSTAYAQDFPLHAAARSQAPFNSLNLLLDQADTEVLCHVNKQDIRGNTPLTLITMGFLNQKITYSAYRTFSPRYIEQLIKSTILLLVHGADPTIATNTGFSPLPSLIRALCFFHDKSSINEEITTNAIEYLMSLPKRNASMVIDR